MLFDLLPSCVPANAWPDGAALTGHAAARHINSSSPLVHDPSYACPRELSPHTAQDEVHEGSQRHEQDAREHQEEVVGQYVSLQPPSFVFLYFCGLADLLLASAEPNASVSSVPRPGESPEETARNTVVGYYLAQHTHTYTQT